MKQPKSLIKKMIPKEIKLEKKRAKLSTLEEEPTVPQRVLIERGLGLAEFPGKREKEYICTILNAKFVLIPAGTFMMGSPEDAPGRFDAETLHQVTISKPFYMQMTEITVGQWRRFVKRTRYRSDAERIGWCTVCSGKKWKDKRGIYWDNSGFSQSDAHPVTCISWNDVQKFIRELNKMEGTDKYRLPTEAQWEYACRAGSTTAYCFGDDVERLDDYAWYIDNSGEETHPVAQKKPNTWGLYDMHGNVSEWVRDWYGDYPTGHLTDPTGDPPISLGHVFRGGYYTEFARHCRSAQRGCLPGFYPLSICGFRLIRTVEQDRYEPDQRDSPEGEPSKLIKGQLAKSKCQFVTEVRETSRDVDFIAYNNGTVLDTRTHLMWAEEDNKFGINWADAEHYCENYHGGGYKDWRMPTLDELAGLYDKAKTYKSACGYDVHSTELIRLTCVAPWASETRGSLAAQFDLNGGGRYWFPPTTGPIYRVLPVRSVPSPPTGAYKGVRNYENGDKYEGVFVNGKLTSKGTFTCSNGKQFTGNLEGKEPLGLTITCD